MRPYVWPAILGLIAGGAVFLIALTGGRLAPRLSGQPLAEATTLSGLAANIVLLFVAVLALLVAGAAYREAHETSVQQEKLAEAQETALAESRQALAAAAGQLTEHRRLLDTSAAALEDQLKAVQQAYEDERKRAALRPSIDIRVGEITGSQLNSLIRVDIDAQGYTPIDFLLVNSGDADLTSPTVAVQAFPPTVFVDQRDVHILERPDHNVLQLSPGDIRHKTEPVRCAVDVKVPLDVSEFHIAVSVFRQSFSATTRNFRFAAGRRLRQGKF
jgi:Na+-transporting methylmalonyl-CoA/oxaloacetate decarboxylase gamma subunit